MNVIKQEKGAPSPAPWFATEISEGRIVIGTRDNRTIVVLRAYGDELTAEERANAVLIAAAPELLTALEAVLATFRAGDETLNPGKYSFPANGATADALRTAIAKARGE